LYGCNPIALSLLGAGAGLGVNHEMSAIATRTFSQPMLQVHKATLLALHHMSIKIEKVDHSGALETIHATAGDRRIEVELQSLTGTTTRARAMARVDMLTVDGATAQEILAQTERSLPRS
jgi:hypothetical protein